VKGPRLAAAGVLVLALGVGVTVWIGRSGRPAAPPPAPAPAPAAAREEAPRPAAPASPREEVRARVLRLKTSIAARSVWKDEIKLLMDLEDLADGPDGALIREELLRLLSDPETGRDAAGLLAFVLTAEPTDERRKELARNLGKVKKVDAALVHAVTIRNPRLRQPADAREAFWKVQRFAAEWHANTFAGSIVRKVTRGMWAIDLLNDTLLLALLPSFVVLVGSTALLGYYWPLMGLVVTVGALTFIFMTAFLSIGYIGPAARLSNQWDTKTGGALADAVTCNPVVKSFGAELREDARLLSVMGKWKKRTYRTWMRHTYSSSGQILFRTTGGTLKVLDFGIARVRDTRAAQATPWRPRGSADTARTGGRPYHGGYA